MLDDFVTRALLAGIGVALVTGPAGCFVVWRRLAYFGETIAHSALLGVALALLADFHIVRGIFVCASAIVLMMFFLEGRDALPSDTLLGMFAYGGLAVGLVVLAFFPAVRFNLNGLLFGDLLFSVRDGNRLASFPCAKAVVLLLDRRQSTKACEKSSSPACQSDSKLDFAVLP
ncbi:MAG: metal ABC transporter permease [Paracoccaceae bacterium]|nr:metal ABC transporter permease [Paracoccaceae bacterium]